MGEDYWFKVVSFLSFLPRVGARGKLQQESRLDNGFRVPSFGLRTYSRHGMTREKIGYEARSV